MQEVKRIQRYFSAVGIFTARAVDAVGGGIPAHIQCVPRFARGFHERGESF
jgi:hypothetical protein